MPNETERETTYLTTQELADRARVHVNTVYKWVERGCPCREIGKGFRFVWEEVDEWLRTDQPKGEEVA